MNQLIFLILVMISTSSPPKSPQDFVWKHRILIVCQPHSEEFWMKENLTDLLLERKLLVFWFEGDRLIRSNYKGEIDAESFIRRLSAESSWALIGLDGGTKSIGKSEPVLEEILKIIDSMPMRVRERNGNF